MGKFSFIGRRPNVPVAGNKNIVADQIAVPEIPPSAPEPEKPQKITALDNELFLPVARQLGEENESIRNLLIDAEHKIEELDVIKRAIGKLVEPVTEKLRTLEAVRSELGTAEKKIVMLDGEVARLRESGALAQQKIIALESTKTEQSAELATRNAQIADLQGRMLQQGGEIQAARDENRHLSEGAALADKRAAKLESEGEVTRQKLMVSETERATVQKSLDKAFVDIAQMSQRLLDTEKSAAATQIRMQNAEQMLADTQAERHRLATALDEAMQKHQSEIASQKSSYEALQGRAALTEKLIEDMRKSMRERAEEIQSFDRRLAESLPPPPGMPREPEAPRPVAVSRRVDSPPPPQSSGAIAQSPTIPQTPGAIPPSPTIMSRDARGSYPGEKKPGLWRSDFFDWIAGRFGP